MADGLKRDDIVILRIDGEDLLEFLEGPSFEPEMLSIFSEIESSNETYSEHLIRALEKLKVDQGMPPAKDTWVKSNLIDVALQSCSFLEEPIAKETVLVHFKKVGEIVAELLKEQPVIVAHRENVVDGSGVKRILSNKFELDKTLSCAVHSVPRDPSGKLSNEYLRAALEFMAPSAGLPLVGAVHQMDNVIDEAFKTLNATETKMVEEEEFKKLLTEVLANMLSQLEDSPITVSTNSVLHEPLASSSGASDPPPP